MTTAPIQEKLGELKHIDESRLESDLAYRFEFLTEFIGFDAEDIATIHASAELLAPIVPTLVDAVYGKQQYPKQVVLSSPVRFCTIVQV